MARHGLAFAFTAILVVLILVNFLSQYASVFRYNFITRKSQDAKINEYYEVQSSNVFEDNLVVTPNDISHREINPKKCEVIHIGLVCGGYQANLHFYTMLKSLYFYRNNPLHFHIMVNRISEKVLRTLFDTWDVPQVEVSFYDINSTVPDVRWVPNSHYSGLFGLLKLTFPKVVNSTVTSKLIVLDTDLTFNGDIVELWEYFNCFKPKQVIGLVENQSNFYLKKNHPYPWPAVERGYNTGVMLFYISRLERIGWGKMWMRITKRTAIIYGATRLADQDIVNAVIKQDTDLVFNVPCQWNIQLSDHTHSYYCYESNQVKVLHWNSPRKFNVVNKNGDYFRTIYTTFLELNGNLLKRQLYDCKMCANATEGPADICSDFHSAPRNKWRTLLFFREFKYVPVKDDVTFVAQLSYDRLQLIEELCKHWEGPLSLTLYLTDTEFQQSYRYIQSSELLADRVDVAYHVVFKEGKYHPINVLRNVGLRHVNTPFVFLADVDFLPMYGLYGILRNRVGLVKNMGKKALIVPAFETQRYRSKFPKNKKELLVMLDNKSIFTFRYDVWSVGHSSTNYVKWRTASVPYTVKWAPDFEPYIVVRKDVTEYDITFMGFGWNKVSHIMELEAQGYEFVVLPNAFIVHKPHAPSYDIAKFRTDPNYRMCIQILKEEFVKKLNKKYGSVYENRTNSIVLVSQ